MNEINERRLEVANVFLKLGALGFGGPAIFGLIQAEVQERRAWMSKDRFLEGMALVNALPGAAATQMCIYSGYQRAGWWGGLLAGLGFMLPAFFIMLSLTYLSTTFGSLPLIRHAFYGLGPVVLGLFAFAVFRLAQNAIRDYSSILIAVLAAAAVSAFRLGIGEVLLLAGCVGVGMHFSAKRGVYAGLIAIAFIIAERAILPTFSGSMMNGEANAAAPTLFNVAAFFLKVGTVTFGGGITILAFVQDQVVNQLHWISMQDFLEGLAIGQFTPGPIIMLAAFIGYKVAGIAGATVAAVAIFLPSFILMLSILPIVDKVRNLDWVRAAMRGIAPAVVGSISVSIIQLTPHAAPDVFTSLLLLLTIAAMAIWRASAMKLLLLGATIGVIAKSRVLLRLKELA